MTTPNHERHEYHESIKLKLFRSHLPNTKGTWVLRSEDCGEGARHLETVIGTYANVVDYALTLKGFIGWGHGGTIQKVDSLRDVDTIASVKRLEALRAEREKLSERLREIATEINEIVDT